MPRPLDPSRDLLFGLLALQTGLINQAQLVAAFHAWTQTTDRPMAAILAEQGALSDPCLTLVEGLVIEHLRRHGSDPQRSLAAMGIGRSTRECLAQIRDAELDASLAHLGAGATEPDGDPDRTASYAVGESTSDGQRFRVLRPHAQGGLGAVFVALDAELHREVALKQILDQHADDPISRQRFLLEAKITGGLEHPGIVPVYGLGTYAGGRPYYAMRFIRGDSLKEAIGRFHADEGTHKDPGRRTLALNKLLRRFLDVCNAVAYAHSRGVLHRDLKPGNILLGDYGETLVVDWGLAKAIGHHLESAPPAAGERTLRPESGSDVQPTMIGQRLGTPAYMPPEQAAGRLLELGAPSDVYSLGATLYALLTGQAPFKEPDLPTLLRQVEQGDFPRPRQVHRWIDPALEAVCLKAMALRAQDRYPSPRALAEDIEHWLADEPVTARRDPPWTRSWRWVRKHRTLATSAAAVVLLATAGLGIGLQRERLHAARISAERSEAERRLDQVMNSYEEYFTGFNEGVLSGQRLPQALLESLLTKPRKFYERLTIELEAKPVRTTKERVLLGRGRYSLGRILWMLGRHAESEREFQATVRISEALTRDYPGEPQYRNSLASSHNARGRLLHETGRVKEAEGAYGKGIAEYERLVQEHPGVPDYQAGLAHCHDGLGLVLDRTGRAKEAEEAYGRAIAGYERLVKDHPGVPDYQAGLATSHLCLGIVLAQTGRVKDAEEAFSKAIAALERLVKDHPGVPDYQVRLASNHNNLGLVLAQAGRVKDAEEAYGKAIAALERLLVQHPEQPDYRSRLGGALSNLGQTLVSQGDFESAIARYREAIGHQRAVFDRQPEVIQYRQFLSKHYQSLAEALRARRQVGEAAGATRERMRLWPGNPGELYNAACEFALCVPIAKDDAMRESFADEAMATLRAAVAAGWSRAAHTAWDLDLAPVRHRPDFRDLLMDMTFPSDPFSKNTEADR